MLLALKAVPSVLDRHLKKFNLGAVKPNGGAVCHVEWAPAHAWIAFLLEIEAELGTSALYLAGLHVMEHARWPPGVRDMDAAIQSIDVAYHMNHRKKDVIMSDPATVEMLEEIGHYGYSRVNGERRILSVCDNPYPCSLDRGILTGVAIRFNSRAIVSHYPEIPCRGRGDLRCTYLITW